MAPAKANSWRWVFFGCGSLLLVALSAAIGPRTIVGLLATLGTNFPVLVAVFFTHECVRAIALGQCSSLDRRLPYVDLLRVRLLGELTGALTRTGPFGAEPTRAMMLARRSSRASQGIGDSASELIANSLISGCVTLGVLAVGLWRGSFHGPLQAVAQVLFWISAAYVVIAVVALWSRTYVIGTMVDMLHRVPLVGRLLAVKPAHVRQVEESILRSLTGRRRATLAIVSLELVAQALLVFEIFWTIRSMGIPVSVGTAFDVEVLIKAPNIIHVLGATEGGYALVFTWLGMSAAVGFTLSIVRLLRSLAAVGIGLGLVAALEQTRIGTVRLEN